MDRVRWGILGTGGINRRFLVGASEASNAEVVAVGSRTPERAAAFAGQYRIGRAHGTYEALLDDPDVEVIYNCLPNSLHHPWTMRALAAGKHVLCEKPYTRHPAEVSEAFDAADAAGLLLMEAFMWRHTPQARRFVELMPEIGRLQAIRATFSFVIGEPPDVRLDAGLEGGSLMDIGCYCVSGARLLAGGEPVAVQGVQEIGPTGVDVRFSGLLTFGGGLTATIQSGFTSAHATLEAIGPDGRLFLIEPWNGKTSAIQLDGRDVPVVPEDPYRLEVENLSSAIRGQAEPLLGRADAYGQARAIEALYRAAASGSSVGLATPVSA